MSPGQMSKSRVEAPSAPAEPRLAPQPGLQYLRAKCRTRSSHCWAGATVRPALELRPGPSSQWQGQQALTRPPAASLDHLVGAAEHGLWNGQAECVGGLEIDHRVVLRCRLHRQVGRLLALKDAIDG